MTQSPLKNPFLIFLFAVSSLFLGGVFIYISIKAPFYWGGAFLPGVLLLIVFAIIAVVGVVTTLLKPVRPSH